MYPLVSYFKFLLKSTNQYGIHSPFVFDYTTKCLYSKPRRSKIKTLDVLLKSIEYFNCTSLQIEQNPPLRKYVTRKIPNISFSAQPKDLIYFGKFPEQKQGPVLKNHHLHNNSLLIFDNIRKDPWQMQGWLNFIEQLEITVSMDLYHCGIVFVRREQEKQHFAIRI